MLDVAINQTVYSSVEVILPTSFTYVGRAIFLCGDALNVMVGLEAHEHANGIWSDQMMEKLKN